MKPMKKRLITGLLCFALTASIFSGCGKEKTYTPDPAESQEPVVTYVEPTAAPEEPEPTPEPQPYDDNGMLKVPFLETQSVRVWDVLEDGSDPSSSNLDAALGALLNVSLSYSYATESTAQESFDLMVAGDEYPDLMADVDKYYTGGADAAMDDGLILCLDGMAQDIPNTNGLIVENADDFALSQSQRLYKLPVLEYASVDASVMGLATRADGLEYLEITSPETYDEFYFLLVMLKNICGAKRGYLLPDDGFSPGLAYGYGAYNGFYQVDNVVKFGFMEAEYKSYMDFVYVLLDNRLAIYEDVSSGYNLSGRIRSGWVDTWYGDLEDWDAAEAIIGEGKVAGITYPVVERGDTIHLLETHKKEPHGMCVSGQLDDSQKEVVFALCNYLYSDEFTLIASYGQEYVENGAPVITDQMKTGDMTPALMMNLPHRVDLSALAAVKYSDAQVSAVDMWTQGDGAYLLPELDISPEDQETIDTIMADINALVLDFVPGFEQGDYDAYDYEDIRNQILELGLQQVLDIYQMALTGETIEYEDSQESLNDKKTQGRYNYSYTTAPAVTTEEPAETETPAEGEAPVEGEVPAQPETPIEGETPAETETPAEGEAPAETEAPAEGETPPETEAPSESDGPAEDTGSDLVLAP